MGEGGRERGREGGVREQIREGESNRRWKEKRVCTMHAIRDRE